MTETEQVPATAKEEVSTALIYQQIRRSPEAIAGIAILGVVILSAIFASWIAPYNPYAQNLSATLLPPRWRTSWGPITWAETSSAACYMGAGSTC